MPNGGMSARSLDVPILSKSRVCVCEVTHHKFRINLNKSLKVSLSCVSCIACRCRVLNKADCVDRPISASTAELPKGMSAAVSASSPAGATGKHLTSKKRQADSYGRSSYGRSFVEHCIRLAHPLLVLSF